MVERSKEDLEYPDEVDTPVDQLAKTRRFMGCPSFSSGYDKSVNPKHKWRYERFLHPHACVAASLYCPTIATPTSIIIIHKTKAIIRFMFFNADDVRWFQPVDLFTKKGCKGNIKKSLGTHGYMKCLFDNPLSQADTSRGPKKHIKRLAAPKNWYLSKLGGIYAPHPSSGPHKIRECLPIIILIRNLLKYALSYDEAKMIAKKRLIRVDGKIRTDMFFPCGFQDVIYIEKTNSYFRLLYDVKGRFVPHTISAEEASYKLCRVKKIAVGLRGIPYATTHDGRTIRFIQPDVKVNDTVRVDIETGKILDILKFDVGQKVMVTGGHSIGRVGTIIHREKHPGSHEIVQIRDARKNVFATLVSNVFVIGSSEKFWITLPKQKGIRVPIMEDLAQRFERQTRANV
ncbi:small ribosomal subunit protein eS4-like [Danaus plexippus]|uniref:small ribosomal subunit protein eS4-like n=1 Tax=Danaus plexippus TaxID=13037 RepID=UPI002AB0DD31|nr:small ribosomal subunit protein eS4-like [Danaus plexippus]